jgi:inosose dehydratase
MHFSRRRFLALSAAATAGATWFNIPQVLKARGIDVKDDPFGGFPIGAQSYSLREFNLIDAVRHLKGLGLHYTEFFSKHLALDATVETIKETLALLKEADIQLVAHGVSGFTKDHDANRKIFEFARKAGFKNITANPELDSFDSLDKLCEEFDLRICIHNHGPGALYDKIADVTKVVKNRHKNIGACIDTGHFIRTAEDPVKAVHELKGRTFALHIKDEAEQKPDSHNVIIGTGHLDLVGLFKALKDTDFPADGAISLEYEAKPENPIDDAKLG